MLRLDETRATVVVLVVAAVAVFAYALAGVGVGAVVAYKRLAHTQGVAYSSDATLEGFGLQADVQGPPAFAAGSHSPDGSRDD